MKGLRYYINYIANVIKTKFNPTLLLPDKSEEYKDLMQNEKIQNIIKNMPNDLDEFEKAYYIYLELGKIVIKNSGLFLSTSVDKIAKYNELMDDDLKGVCKTISELYCAILRQPEINIKADMVKFNPEDTISHIETVLNINNEIYLCDLIADLENIKSGKRTKCFCYNMNERIKRVKRLDLLEARKRVEDFYGKNLKSISKEKLEDMDKKFNYAFVSKNDDSQMMYTDDVHEMIYDELKDAKTYKEFVLKGENVDQKDKIKYKMDFIFNNMNNYTKHNGRDGLLETLYLQRKIMTRMMTQEERKQITDNMHICTMNGDPDNLTAILKINESYYLYSPEKRTFVETEKEEIKKYVNKNKLQRLAQDVQHDRATKEQLEEDLEL